MYISLPLKSLLLLLFVAVIATSEPIRTRPCISCFKYWSPEECAAMGKDHVEATCTSCSACVDPPKSCVLCFKYWSKEECAAMGKDHVEVTCDHCSACVDPQS